MTQRGQPPRSEQLSAVTQTKAVSGRVFNTASQTSSGRSLIWSTWQKTGPKPRFVSSAAIITRAFSHVIFCTIVWFHFLLRFKRYIVHRDKRAISATLLNLLTTNASSFLFSPLHLPLRTTQVVLQVGIDYSRHRYSTRGRTPAPSDCSSQSTSALCSYRCGSVRSRPRRCTPAAGLLLSDRLWAQRGPVSPLHWQTEVSATLAVRDLRYTSRQISAALADRDLRYTSTGRPDISADLHFTGTGQSEISAELRYASSRPSEIAP